MCQLIRFVFNVVASVHDPTRANNRLSTRFTSPILVRGLETYTQSGSGMARIIVGLPKIWLEMAMIGNAEMVLSREGKTTIKIKNHVFQIWRYWTLRCVL